MRPISFLKIFGVTLFLVFSTHCPSSDPNSPDPSGNNPGDEIPTPTLSTVSPNLVPTTGGMEVTLTGSGFTKNSIVLFQDQAAPSITWISSSTIRVIVPALPGVQGEVSIQVINRQDQTEKSIKADHLFSYYPAEMKFSDPTPMSGISKDASVLLLPTKETGIPTLVVATPNGPATDLSLAAWDITGPSFQIASPFSSPMTSVTVVAASDINGDQKSDLVLGTSTGPVLVYENDGSPHFSTNTSLVTKTNTPVNFLLFGDFNNDQKKDIGVVVGSYAGTLLKDEMAPGGFKASNWISSGMNPKSVVALDFDQDQNHYLDLLVATSTQVNSLKSNNGNGFQIPLQFSTIPTTNGLFVADFTGDGQPEIGSLSGSGTTSLTLYNLQGTTWQAQTPIDLTGAATDIIRVDMNGDGVLDILATGDTGTAIVLLGQGNGVYGTPQSFQGAPSSKVIGVVDLNNDRKLDLLMFSHATGGGISILLNSSQ